MADQENKPSSGQSRDLDFYPEKTEAVGKITSGLFIVTAGWEGKFDGYLGSWIQQVSFKPLLISVAIRPGRPCYDYILEHGNFCVNIIGQRNEGVLKPFWQGYAPERDPFASLEKTYTSRGNIILTGAMAAIECRRISSLKPGDHELIIAGVVECHMLKPDDKPLAHIRKSGLDY